MTVEQLLDAFNEVEATLGRHALTPDEWAGLEPEVGMMEALRPWYIAAKQYVIARDQGIDAAVLWKLANG